jgi:acyl-CoA thioesterase-1
MRSLGIDSTNSYVKSVWLALVLLAGSMPGWSAESTIVVLGDSLSSGHGLPLGQSWVSMLEDRLKAEGYGYEVVNASIAGDTSSGGLARLPSLLDSHAPAIVIIELGGNDGLRGQPVQSLESNLAAIIELTKNSGAQPVLAGMQIPPNYGPRYTAAFSGIYPELARRFGVPLVDFLLEDVALNAELMQPDGIHPNALGSKVMLDNVWAVLTGFL